MYLFWTSLLSLLVSVLNERTISLTDLTALNEETISLKDLVKGAFSLEELALRRNKDTAPLAVIKTSISSKLQLANPHKYGIPGYVGYNYLISKDKTGPGETLMIACPAYEEKQLQIEENWKKSNEMSNESKLLFLSEYDKSYTECSSAVVPSIKKVERDEGALKYCSQSHAEMYEIGYPVSNDDGTEVQFLSIYKICYTKVEDKGAIKYSIHQISSPSLLFQNPITELPELDLFDDKYYKSSLDESLSEKESFKDKNHYPYQFVGIEDMPVKSWEMTAMFLFNHTPITRNADVFKGMIMADNYIRLYSNRYHKPLILYSGTYRKQIESKMVGPSMFHQSKFVDLFWRIIMDVDDQAIILVTQHTLKKCGQAYLCKNNLKEKKFEKGGCIYTCSLKGESDLLEKLDLPLFKDVRDLDFTIETRGIETMSPDGRGSSSKTIDIFEFLKSATLMDTLANVDPVIARNVYTLNAEADHSKTLFH